MTKEEIIKKIEELKKKKHKDKSRFKSDSGEK